MSDFFTDAPEPDARLYCPTCERANAPTRTACLYCGAALPIVDASRQRPTFRQLEEWEAGYNVICFPHDDTSIHLAHAAAWLQMPPETLAHCVEAAAPVPLRRLATQDEALLVCQKMQDFGLDVGFIPDRELALQEAPPQRVRRLDGDETTVTLDPIGGNPPFSVNWDAIKLFVPGRLVTRQANTQERTKRGQEQQEIIDTSETGQDELILDVYAHDLAHSWRIHSNGFDFSCLREAKGLLATNNFARLCEELRACAPDAVWQDAYDQVRPLLATVWPPTQQSASQGWQRTRGSGLTRQTVVTNSNETQFTRFSRLCYHLALNET